MPFMIIKCTRLIDRLIPSSIIWTDTYGTFNSDEPCLARIPSDVKRFRRSASWLAEDLFLEDDLYFATSESLARVAKTIISLVYSVNPNPICSKLLRRIRSCEGPHKLFMPTCDQSTFGQSLTLTNRSASDQSTHNQPQISSTLLISDQPHPTFNQSSPNQPTSDKWFSDKWSCNISISNQSPPSGQSPSSSLPPLSGLPPLSTGSLSSLSNQSPLSNQPRLLNQLPLHSQSPLSNQSYSPPTSQPSSQLLPPITLPPGYPLPPGYQSPTGYQSLEALGYQSPPRYQLTTDEPLTDNSSNTSVLLLVSQSPSNQLTLNKFNIPNNDPCSNTNSSHCQEDNIGNERGDAAFARFCMTPTVSTEMISPVQNESPSETLTDMNTIAIYLMAVCLIAVGRASGLVGNNGHPTTNTRIVPSDSLISNPIPPLVVGQPITSPNPNLSSTSQLDTVNQTSSNKRSTGSNSVSGPAQALKSRSGSADSSVLPLHLPRRSRKAARLAFRVTNNTGEIDLASVRQPLRPDLNHAFGSALHPGRLERTVNFPIASRQYESTDLPQTRTLVLEVAGEARREYVGIPSQI